MTSPTKRPTMIVDCDPGHDDVFALVVANHYANLIGITAVHGNAPLSRTLPNALISCDVFGISVPVFAGADRPLVAPPRLPVVVIEAWSVPCIPLTDTSSLVVRVRGAAVALVALRPGKGRRMVVGGAMEAML